VRAQPVGGAQAAALGDPVDGVVGVLEQILGPADPLGAQPLRRTFGLTSASDGVLAVDLAVRDWSRHDQAIAERLRRIDNRRMDYLRSLFGAFCSDPDDVEARCMLSFSLLIGNHFIAADHGPRSRADVVNLALRRLGAQ